MKITDKTLSIPPYISTAWENISSLTLTKEAELLVILSSGHEVFIPNLSGYAIEEIFKAHESHIEAGDAKKPNLSAQVSFGAPLMPGAEGLSPISFSQHDPSQAHLPNIPAPILEKITSVVQTLGMAELIDQAPKAEPHCNCPFCQIARVLSQEPPKEEVAPEEAPVEELELQFRDWEVNQLGDHLFQVTSPLDKTETFQVFLGEPIGCTCGHNNCEHIKAALQS